MHVLSSRMNVERLPKQQLLKFGSGRLPWPLLRLLCSGHFARDCTSSAPSFWTPHATTVYVSLAVFSVLLEESFCSLSFESGYSKLYSCVSL